jgi:hypothetical protein
MLFITNILQGLKIFINLQLISAEKRLRIIDPTEMKANNCEQKNLYILINHFNSI